MLATARQRYNASFSVEKYEAMIRRIHADFPNQLEFRVAETPLFIPHDFGNKIKTACEQIIDTLIQPDFKAKTARAIPADQYVPNENAHTSFLAIDFAVCAEANGDMTPQLIELQGFPSIFGFQAYMSTLYPQYFDCPKSGFSAFFGGLDVASYWETLRSVILGDCAPENVILLEIFPEKQKTRIDFAVTQKYLGIDPVCLTKIKKDGLQLYYEKAGRRIDIHRIYNRLIFDDLQGFPDIQTEYKLTDDTNVTWVGHPNWFFRISKYTLPMLKSPYIPESFFLSDVQEYPADLENYVLKPLFSFAGSGVKLHITPQDLDQITDREKYLLQRKVQYVPVIQAVNSDTTGKVKAEIRMLYVWEEGAPRPQLIVNLSRLSRGEMIGVRFNKDFDWVGGSTCFFEE